MTQIKIPLEVLFLSVKGAFLQEEMKKYLFLTRQFRLHKSSCDLVHCTIVRAQVYVLTILLLNDKSSHIFLYCKAFLPPSSLRTKFTRRLVHHVNLDFTNQENTQRKWSRRNTPFCANKYVTTFSWSNRYPLLAGCSMIGVSKPTHVPVRGSSTPLVSISNSIVGCNRRTKRSAHEISSPRRPPIPGYRHHSWFLS